MSAQTNDCVRRTSEDTSFDEDSLSEYVRRAQGGDAEAFAVIARNMRPRLLVVLRKRMQGHDDVEDIAQDTFAKAWHSIQSYDHTRSFVAWIYTIALRRATDYSRCNSRRKKISQPLIENANLLAPTNSSVNDRDAAGNVWAVAKDVLSASQYTALWLRYAEELSVSEIAVTMGKSQVAIRVMLHRSRSLLRKLLAASEVSDE